MSVMRFLIALAFGAIVVPVVIEIFVLAWFIARATPQELEAAIKTPRRRSVLVDLAEREVKR